MKLISVLLLFPVIAVLCLPLAAMNPKPSQLKDCGLIWKRKFSFKDRYFAYLFMNLTDAFYPHVNKSGKDRTAVKRFIKSFQDALVR